MQPFPAGGAKVQVSNESGAQGRWSRDGTKFYYIAPDRKLMEVVVQLRDGKIAPGIPRPLFQTQITGACVVVFQYDVSADGNKFLVNSLRPGAPLTLVTDWTAELRK